jgi:hypothetical protein
MYDLKQALDEQKQLTLDQFKEMSLEQILLYFNNYSKLKTFCAMLTKESQKEFVYLPSEKEYNVNSIFTKEQKDKIKDTYLKYMCLPDVTSKSDKNAKKLSKFRSIKFRNLMTSMMFLKGILKLNNNDKKDIKQ